MRKPKGPRCGLLRAEWKRGVMTVEASVIIPMLSVMVILLIILLFSRHNLNYYTAAAGEAALKGNAAAEGGTESPVSAARSSAEGRIRDQTMPGSRPDAAVSCGDWGCRVSFSGQRFSVSRSWFGWSAEIAVPKIHPAEELRRKWHSRRRPGAEADQ